MAPGDQPNVVAIFSPSLAETRERLDKWVKRLLGDRVDEYSVVRLDAAARDPDSLTDHLGGLSLLAAERVVVIDRADEWSPSQQRRFLQMLRNLPPGISVIITVCGEQATRRSVLQQELQDFIERYGAIERVGTLQFRDARDWVRQRVRAGGAQIAPAAVDALLERTGADRDRLTSEIDKLITYAGEGATITAQMVEQLVPRTAEANIFALIDAITEGRADEALRLLAEVMPESGDDQAAAHLLFLLTRHLRLIWQARVLLQSGHRLETLSEVPEEWVGKLPADPNVVATVRGRDWMARKLEDQARALPESAIVRALREAYAADLTLKGLLDRRLPARAVMEILVSRLCMLRGPTAQVR